MPILTVQGPHFANSRTVEHLTTQHWLTEKEIWCGGIHSLTSANREAGVGRSVEHRV